MMQSFWGRTNGRTSRFWELDFHNHLFKQALPYFSSIFPMLQNPEYWCAGYYWCPGCPICGLTRPALCLAPSALLVVLPIQYLVLVLLLPAVQCLPMQCLVLRNVWYWYWYCQCNVWYCNTSIMTCAATYLMKLCSSGGPVQWSRLVLHCVCQTMVFCNSDLLL